MALFVFKSDEIKGQAYKIIAEGLMTSFKSSDAEKKIDLFFAMTAPELKTFIKEVMQHFLGDQLQSIVSFIWVLLNEKAHLCENLRSVNRF